MLNIRLRHRLWQKGADGTARRDRCFHRRLRSSVSH
jgi:hypothetical protein